MKRLSLLAFTLGLAVSACGGASPTKPVAPAAPAADKGASTPVAAQDPSRRGPPEAFVKAWPFKEPPRFVVHADLGGLLKTKVGAGAVQTVMLLAGDKIPAAERKCIDAAVSGVREMALGGGGDVPGGVLMVRFDPSVAPQIPACIEATGKAKRDQVPGVPYAWSLGKDEEVAVLTKDGFFVGGTRELVDRALSGRGAGAGLAAVGLAKDEFVSWSVEIDEEKITSKGTLLLSDERFRLSATTDLPNEQIAKLLESRMGGPAREQALEQITGGGALGAQEAQALARLVKAFELKRVGKRVDLKFELVEPPLDQARDLGVMSALAVAGVRKYISNAKQAEAKNTVSHLARLVVAEWETEDGKPRAKRKLVSFPPVPKAVPKGEKFQSAPADWKPWAPLKFEMTSPQYYQYEIKAAKDGESAEIIARGDLNGDGKTSEFKVLVKVQRRDGSLWTSPSIEQKDADE